MKHRSPVFSNGAWSLLTQLVRVGSLAAVTIGLSRHFGPQRFGLLAVGLAFVRIFAVVANFGLDRILVRHLVEEQERSAGIVYEAFWLKLVIALFSYLAMLLLVFVVEPGNRLLLCIAALAGTGLLFQSFDVCDYLFQAQERFRLSFFGRGLPILLSTIIKILALIANAPLLFFAAAESIESVMIAGALYLLYRRSIRPSPVRPVQVIAPRLLIEGLPLVLSALAVMVYMRTDVVMLGKLIGYQTAGIYAAASQVCEACAVLPAALMPALFPVLVRWRRFGKTSYQYRFEWIFLAASIIGVLVSLGLSLGAHTIVTVLFGPNYLAAADVLAVSAWTVLFMFIGIAQSSYDITEGLTWFATTRTFLGALLNIVLNWLFIPRYGAIGSAVATLTAQIFSSVLLNAAHPRTRPIFRMQIRSMLLVPVFRTVSGRQPLPGPGSWQQI